MPIGQTFRDKEALVRFWEEAFDRLEIFLRTASNASPVVTEKEARDSAAIVRSRRGGDVIVSRTFQQTVAFQNVSARDLYRTYMDSSAHAAALGAPATISSDIGGSFKIFGDDGVSGTNLAIIPDKLVVQAWRGRPWKPNDSDSTLILVFEDRPSGARIYLTQVNVPDHAYDLVNPRAWNKLYWDRWKQHFSDKQRPRRGGQ